METMRYLHPVGHSGEACSEPRSGSPESTLHSVTPSRSVPDAELRTAVRSAVAKAEMDSGLRRNDGAGVPGAYLPLPRRPFAVTPAQAGVHPKE